MYQAGQRAKGTDELEQVQGAGEAGRECRTDGSIMGFSSELKTKGSLLACAFSHTQGEARRDWISFLRQLLSFTNSYTVAHGCHPSLSHLSAACFLGSSKSLAHNQCSPKAQTEGHTAELNMSPRLTHLTSTVLQRYLSLTSKMIETCDITKNLEGTFDLWV